MPYSKEDFITDEKTAKVFVSLFTGREKDWRGLVPAIRRKLKAQGIYFSDLAYTVDVWARDYMPVEVFPNVYLSYKYDPDYLTPDQKEYYITDWHKVREADRIRLGEKLVVRETGLVLDGGNVIRAIDKDNIPVLIMTDKVLTDNHFSEEELRKVISDCTDGIVDVCLVPWEGNVYEGGKEDNPVGHSDGVVRYVAPGHVLMTNLAMYDDPASPSFADMVRDALKDRFEVQELSYSGSVSEDKRLHTWGYINFLHVGRYILVPSLDCEYDTQALQQISDVYKSFDGSYVVEQIDYDMTEVLKGADEENPDRNGGGALNCQTWTR